MCVYWLVFEQYGFEEFGEKFNVMFKQGQWSEMVVEVLDDVVCFFCVVGWYDEIVGVIEVYFGGFCDVVGLSVLMDMFGEMMFDLIEDVKQIVSFFEVFLMVFG